MANAENKTNETPENQTGGWFDKFLKGTHNHFLCSLPESTGFLNSMLLKLFYKGIRTEKNQLAPIKGLPDDAVIVYAAQYKSYFDLLFFYTRYRQERLPCPRIALDYRIVSIQPVAKIARVIAAHIHHLFKHRKILTPYESDFVRDELMDGKAGFLSLVEYKGFYRRFVKAKTDPIRYLVEMQKTIDRPIYIVPQLIFFTHKPPRAVPTLIDILFGPEHKPGRFRQVAALFKRPDLIFTETSEPLNLKQYLDLPENRELSIKQLAVNVRRRLLDRVNRHRQSITGPMIKTLPELKESILTSKSLRSFMEQHAEKRDIALVKVYKEAEEYIDEIASDMSMGIIKFGAALIRWFFNLMFDGITVNQDVLNRIKTRSQEAPLVLIPCHKSHIDYLMLSYMLWTNNMPCPQIAAGKNLSFWPLGPFFRGGGAFFIRRTFRGAVLYSRVFKEYLHKLLQEGFNIEFFIEGGRSRTGKLLMPKLGLLSMLIEAYRNGACEDLIFVPIYIGYDRILEESAYLREIEGGKKEDENIWQLIKTPRFLKKRYGKIYMKFQEPFSMKEILREKGVSFDTMCSKDQNALVRELGYRVTNGIDKATVVTPHALVASALLNMPKQYFSHDDLLELVEVYMTYLMSQNATLADTLLYESVYAVEQALETYVNRKFVEKTAKVSASGDPESPSAESATEEIMYRVVENNRPSLEYYKNNSITFFIPAAYTAMAILEKDAFQFSTGDLHTTYNFIQDLFQHEFVQDVDKTPEYFVRKTIKVFIDEAVIMPHRTLPDTYNLTSAGFRKLKLFASFLKTFFESYLIVLNFCMRHPPKELTPKDRLKKVQSKGNRMYKRKLVERPEAMSKINYMNAMDLFASKGIKNAEDMEKIQYFANIIQRYLDLLA